MTLPDISGRAYVIGAIVTAVGGIVAAMIALSDGKEDPPEGIKFAVHAAESSTWEAEITVAIEGDTVADLYSYTGPRSDHVRNGFEAGEYDYRLEVIYYNLCESAAGDQYECTASPSPPTSVYEDEIRIEDGDVLEVLYENPNNIRLARQ